MLCMIDQASKHQACVTTGRCVPADVMNMLKYLCGMFPKLQDRRVVPRVPYHACGALTNCKDSSVEEIWTYDINCYTVGFICKRNLATGTAGPIRLDLPNGACCEIRGRVMRCREFVPGWFEGYIAFSGQLSAETVEAIENSAA